MSARISLRHWRRLRRDSGIEAAHYFRGEINTRVRQAGDLISQLESLVDAKMWPYPTYADILFGV